MGPPAHHFTNTPIPSVLNPYDSQGKHCVAHTATVVSIKGKKTKEKKTTELPKNYNGNKFLRKNVMEFGKKN